MDLLYYVQVRSQTAMKWYSSWWTSMARRYRFSSDYFVLFICLL